MAIYTGMPYYAQQAAYQQHQFGRGGCCPPPYEQGYNQTNWNLPNANVGRHGFLGLATTNGFALDTNHSGRYEAGQDGVLAFDLNRDGRTTPQEIEKSREMLNSFGGNYDINGDGHVTPCERSQGQRQRQEVSQRFDRNHDGVLDKWELAQGGANVLVDRNRDGKFQPWEQHSVFNFPVPGQGRGRLDFVDPHCGINGTHIQQPWYPRYY